MLEKLQISENKRFLMRESRLPFFWLGDTAWELFHKLDYEEACLYLQNRVAKGFNVIQAVALAELDGLRTPNAYNRYPLCKNESGNYDPLIPDLKGNNYWKHVDDIIEFADSLGLYIALLPTWGDKYNLAHGVGPEIFTPDNAYKFGLWMGERYGKYNNIIWVLGGARPLITDEHYEVILGMKKGLQKGEAFPHLITFHPPGDNTSSAFLPEEVDFHMIQSGHMMDCYLNYEKVIADYNRVPVRPVIDGEPRYENIPKNFRPEDGFFNDFDIRLAAYHAVFSGAFGHTYGHSSIWCMQEEITDYYPMTWKQALDAPGSSQMKHLKNLMLSRPFFERIPANELITAASEDEPYLCATKGKGYLMAYTTTGNSFHVKLGNISGSHIIASWYNPKDGQLKIQGTYKNEGTRLFCPPCKGKDWVLILDDSSASYAGHMEG